MLRLEGITKSFGGQVLFEGVDWFLGDRDRVGLIGRNGTGKSTLLRMIADLDGPDRGSIVRPKGQTVGYLPQFGFETGPGTVLEEARRAFQDVLAMRWEWEEIEARLAADGVPPKEAERLLHRHSELEEGFRNHGGYEIERRVHQVLTGLGFSDRDFERPVRTLSGGWQMRVALARLLLRAPDVLLLDEPTNHLDIEARVWLEGFLSQYPGGFLLVSHDRHFLDRTIDRTTEIMLRGLVDYAGNYSHYLQERQNRYEQALKAYERQQEEIARIERFIERFRAKNTKASQVQSRVKMLEKMERLAPPAPPQRAISIRFPQPNPSGRIVVRLQRIHKAYGSQVVFDDVSLDIERGEKVALVGPNGAGKSTLMRILAGTEALQAGTRELGPKVTSESFAQDQADRLPQDRSIIEETIARAPVAIVPQVRGMLGAFLFRGDEVEKKISVLSGGERNRFALMLLLLHPANLLLLDEPTNHLDIDAQEVLLKSLNAYEGTLVFVSHDHHFLENLATRVIEVGGGGVRSFPGDYESYLWKKRQEEEAAALAALGSAEAAAAAAAAAGGPAPGSAGQREGRAAARSEGRRARRLSEVEGEIGKLEERRRRLEDLMASEGFFKDAEKARFYVDEHREVVESLNTLYKAWHDLAEEGA